MATVGELIEKLKRLDPKLTVELEGCDCTNSWDGRLHEGSTPKHVLLSMSETTHKEF